MQISKVLLTTLLVTSLGTACSDGDKDNPKPNQHNPVDTTDAHVDNDSAQHPSSPDYCPACGMG